MKIPSKLRAVLPLVLILIILIIALPHFHSSKQTLQALKDANKLGVIEAILATFVTFILSVGIYKNLAFKKLPFVETLLVQFGAMFINRLAPAGSGAIGVNAAYLHAKKHSLYQAGTVASMNNVLGFIGHGCLLIVVGLTTDQAIPLPYASQHIVPILGGALLILLISAVLFRGKFGKIIKNVGQVVASYRKRPSALILALGLSMLLTLSNVLTLWLSCKAVGIEVAFSTALYALTAGVAAGAAVPTPGGLGGVEAGIYGVLIISQHNIGAVAAAVLLYRLINYWLPFLLGAVSFYVVQRRQLLGF